MTIGFECPGRRPPHGAAAARPHQGREPARRLHKSLAVVGCRRNDAELAHHVHEQDTDVAEMLQLQRQLILAAESLLPCASRSLTVAATKRWATSSEASISTRVAVLVLRIDTETASKRGEEVDQAHRNKKLGADRPIVPKLLQHLTLFSIRLRLVAELRPYLAGQALPLTSYSAPGNSPAEIQKFWGSSVARRPATSALHDGSRQIARPRLAI